MSNLTDRYVQSTLRRLPARQRPDIERELRASIADDVDDRIEAGGDPDSAEVEALTHLGDPARLAAGYADRPLQLIGPAVYLDYTRMLSTLLAAVVPVVAAVVAFLGAVDEEPWLTVAGDSLGAAVTTAVHIAVWTTVVYALIERSPTVRLTADRPWTPDALPEPPSRRARWGELVAETVVLVFVTTFLLLSPGFLSPWLYDTGFVWVFIALGVASLATSFVRYYVRWSLPVALAGSAVSAAGAATLAWAAATDHLLEPGPDWPAGTTTWVTAGLIALAAWSLLQAVADTFTHARRS
ncbi:permease prefix domain 1-containing protein [Actinoplanes sp. NPDC049599]|uniref:permease prefix domain 1-containing protein n=1 Tax=Actinoplanes sp. NPDC049599 TaxID=3363903 RepID=UPI0037B0CA9A